MRVIIVVGLLATLAGCTHKLTEAGDEGGDTERQELLGPKFQPMYMLHGKDIRWHRRSGDDRARMSRVR